MLTTSMACKFLKNWAQKLSPLSATQKYMQSETAATRLEERQFSLEPWVNDDTHLVLPDTTIEKSTAFTLGGITFTINYMGKAHSDGDLTMLVEPDKVLFSGDIIFQGRIPFVGSADSKKMVRHLNQTGNHRTRCTCSRSRPCIKRPKKYYFINTSLSRPPTKSNGGWYRRSCLV